LFEAVNQVCIARRKNNLLLFRTRVNVLMKMNDDLNLLREFARNNSEAAFATLVSRHVNLVYSVALRQVHDSHLAEEITQAVFIILARKADSLGDKTILPGWLCRTARYASANALTIQRRRQHREQEAYMQSILNEAEPAETWNQIAPLLDGAMEKLGQKDHDALVLRFFENKTFAEVGATLGASEDAAKMRVNRALEKLRKFFTKRGVSSTTAIIAGTISANSVQAAPVALAKSVTAVAIAKGAAASGSTLTLIKGALKIMAWTKAKTAIVAGVIVLLAAGMATFAVKTNEAHAENPTVFTVEGIVSTEGRQSPFDTNRVFKSDGKFLFSYSTNGTWWIQFTYQHQSFAGVPASDAQIATMIDDKRISGGMRQIVTSLLKSNEPKPKNLIASAEVRSNIFPDMSQQELFLPWLSLCQNPELPLIGTNLIHINFQHELFNNPKDEGSFTESFLEPERQFVSELTITNNGTIFLADGTTMEYPSPFNNGFVSASYKVLNTTNYHGITFPLETVLYQYAPLPNGKSPQDTYQAVVTKLNVQQIGVGGRNLTLAPVPSRVLAMDNRLRLNNNMTMNYVVTNDQYLALTNKEMEQLANMYRKMSQKIKPKQ
jgi:RNA polymerase sigma factor (sigma-70 family)